MLGGINVQRLSNIFACAGKEKFPTLAFNCVVDHFRQIHYCSEAYYGATNDLQICGDDKYPVALSRGDYENVEFELYKDNGTLVKCKGGYVICDGGMPKDACFIDPQHHHSSRPAVIFAEWLESIRKDVECTFGILKQRFRFLRNKIQYHDMKLITAAFRCCCTFSRTCRFRLGIIIIPFSFSVASHNIRVVAESK
jgi:hypothetical protein